MSALAFWTLPGVWIACAGALLMFVNAVRSWRAPVQFAVYLGLPLLDERDTGFVRLYTLRALFTGVTIATLLAVRDVRALGLLALAASVMPVGDCWLTARAGASRKTVFRHAIIAAVLLAASALLLTAP